MVVSYSEWPDLLLKEKLMNLRRLESLLMSPSPWLRLFLEFFHQFHPANLLYYLHRCCKLLRMTWSIVNRKLMNLRRLESLLLSPSPWLRLFCHLFYQFYHSFISSIICKFLRMTWYIVNRKADKFGTSLILVDLVTTRCRCLSRCLWLCLGRLLFCLCLLYAWVYSSVWVCVCCVCPCAWFVGSSVAMTVGVAGSSSLLSVFAICQGSFLRLRLRLLCLCLCLYPVCEFLHCCDCGCGWVVRSSVCVCYVPGSVFPSASASAVSVPVLDSSAPPSLGLWLRLGRPLLCLCLLYACVCSSICVCICFVSVLVPGLSAPPFASAVSLALPKTLKTELINVAFLDSLGNYV